ncbi:uncharacterized protein LOC128239120 [Mya arenaria]|uniref:uncharacterized protein LOC128239120 n=1 Tax=Mya arenaria TaxID=6604 RepID=UPI0022DFB01F|nr:uncharacterized protein LOC128239120 [Mya arenaria]
MRELGIFLLLVFVHQACCHLCLMSPRQRGDMDISKSGSPTCTRHKLPCGGQPIETPKVMYAPGQTVFFQWQQNYNHYEPGFPGYMDIGIAPNENSTEFTTLTVVTDKYVHSQDYQENYTAIINIPDMECEHCVIRARYNAHKPGETPFLQCADIQISKMAKNTKTLKLSRSRYDQRKLLPLKRALKLKKFYDSKYKTEKESSGTTLYGFAYNPFEPHRSHYVSVDTVSGKLEMLQSYAFGLDDPSGGRDAKFIADEVIAINNWRNTSTVLMHPTGTREIAASVPYTIGSLNGSLVEYGGLFDFDGNAVNGLSWYTDGSSAAFRILPSDKEGSFILEAGILSSSNYQKRASVPEGLYVNYQWLETNMDDYKKVHALLGNENAADELNARIYNFDLFKGDYLGYVELDVSSYTFMSMHSYPGAGKMLYAFSPGLWFDENWAWSLVAIESDSGKVTKACDIAPKGIFQRFYGGSIFQGDKNPDRFLYHVLRVMDSEADFVVAVNPKTCEVRFSEVTNLRHLHSLQRPVPAA